MSRTLRDTAERISPPFLTGPVGRLILGAFVVELDAMGDRVVQGMRASSPEWAAKYMPDALPFIGRDRGIRIGFAEPAASFGARAVRWLDDWATAGNAFTVMAQVRGYLAPFEARLRIVNDGNAWRTVNADGSREYLRAYPYNWNWDDDPAKVSRCWLIIDCSGDSPPFEPGPVVGDPELWGGEVGLPGYTVGSTATPEQLQDLLSIIATFKGGATKYEAIVLAFEADSFDPAAVPGAPGMPDGTWGVDLDHDGDPALPVRLDSARYIRGFI